MNVWEDALENSEIPQYMHHVIINWIEYGTPPGSFLTAVLCNDLREACGRADDTNRHLLFEYVSWLYNNAPADCWGSEENFNIWYEKHHKNVEEDSA